MISVLTFSNFRNHSASRIKTSDAKNIVVTGPNGSGKTSILEAVSIMSASGTLRGGAPAELVQIGANDFGVVAELDNETNISVSWTNGDARRRVMIDGDAVPLSDLARHLRIIWITPREDRLFVETASDRRAFFDRLVAGFDPAHSGRTARLSKLLSERTFALKSRADNNWIAGLDAQIASAATAIAAARVTYAGEINYFLENYAISISGWLEQNMSANTEREYAEYLAANRFLVADKMNIDGAHRTDFGMFNAALDMPVAMTSTGQQKSALLALSIAHAKLIRAKTGKSPIILLDEVAAHLDKNARTHLFMELGKADAQVWMTGIEPESFIGVPNAIFIGCTAGTIQQ
ncbi:MAG: DNA replication and repair protein RecF [Alphaproteobacteria bacterium]|nr:DNA replication and repair protein RecF [Alphaproteobacteria bacterium]MCL2889893.1 DNA replication and repair protein RecF [Alphaproteobacteria bacterium]